MSPQQHADILLAEHQANRRTRMQNTSAILSSIESKASWLKQDARLLADFVALLPIRRDFLTEAEAAIDDAEQQLIEALKVVRQSRAAYNAKPLETSRAA